MWSNYASTNLQVNQKLINKKKLAILNNNNEIFSKLFIIFIKNSSYNDVLITFPTVLILLPWLFQFSPPWHVTCYS